MPNPIKQVRPETVSKERTSAALSAGWARVALKIGRAAFAEQVGIDVSTLKRAMNGPGLPELHTAFASLHVDPTALREVADAYGFEIRPKEARAGNDFATIGDLSRLIARWIEAMEDGHRDHVETLEIAELLCPILPHLNAVMAAAAALKAPTE